MRNAIERVKALLQEYSIDVKDGSVVVFIPDRETADRLYGSAMGRDMQHVFERMKRDGHFAGAFAGKAPPNPDEAA